MGIRSYIFEVDSKETVRKLERADAGWDDPTIPREETLCVECEPGEWVETLFRIYYGIEWRGKLWMAVAFNCTIDTSREACRLAKTRFGVKSFRSLESLPTTPREDEETGQVYKSIKGANYDITQEEFLAKLGE
tara:strand:+ start:643 stop:1044 length:402 start_codon:yes stop_codon:yes gene_type:complete